MSKHQNHRSPAILSVTGAAALAIACGSEHASRPSDASDGPDATYPCNDELKSLNLGSGTAITLVRAFKSGDALSLLSAAPSNAMLATADVCLVKLLVGPGNPGPAGAPSTSAGIGIEVWLPAPASWNERYQAIGGGGWQGGPGFTSLTEIGSLPNGPPPEAVNQAMKGFVTSATDAGHSVAFTGAFAMNPDGSFNQSLFEDLNERSAHVMADKTKALVEAYYGRPPRYSYWNGCSRGGQQGLMEAQRYPDDFDGILAGAPGISQERFHIAALWPQIVMQQDLGAPMAAAKLSAATAAANAACSSTLTGVDDGYISDPSACRYDPSLDANLLCVSAGGRSADVSCLTLAEANAINKMWYGPTLDGTVPPPATSNGWNAGATLNEKQLWYGLARGTFLIGGPIFDGLAGTAVDIPADHVALTLLDPSYATPTFVNATGNGQNRWKTMSYTGPISVPEILVQSEQRLHDLVAADDPDLSAFSTGGGKLLMWHGTRDSLIFPQGSISYYESVAARVGGYSEAQEFARFYLAPGIDHCTAAGPTGINPPVPGGGTDPALIEVLQAWVENGEAPEEIAATSAPGVTPTRTRPWCLYPKKLKYVGGDVETGEFGCE